ncbi:MAG: aminotransferase class I/II-fold pyridoxal phosphate-dependent enzyme, partial [Proteobacteria bacterium]|nr:aminotransferase class I/II-fold pyridoxal phosphate-dependent enzyme [Pseudomonadota bacterium]
AKIKAVPLQVSHGFHSPALEGLDVEPIVATLEVSDPKIPVASGIIDHPYRNANEARDVFRRHAFSPVMFVGAMEQCHATGADLYLQVGAGGPLTSFARGSLPRDHRGIYSLASTNDDDGVASLLESLAQLWVAGVNIDLTSITAHEAIGDIPPACLPREYYWAIKDKVQAQLNVKGVTPRKRVQVAPEDVQTSSEGVGDEIVDKVIAVVSRVSAYPKDALQPGMSLVSDLGFDSLMVGDLATALADAFPGLGGIPQELLINQPTVQTLIDHVRQGGTEQARTVDDNEPLKAYRPRWVSAPMPDWATATTPETVLFAGEIDESVAKVVVDGGIRPIGPDDKADLVVFFASFADPVPVNAVLAGEHPWVDTAAPLLEVLDEQARLGAKPDLIIVRRDDDHWAEALSGVARCVAREWPDNLGKSVSFLEGLSAARRGEILWQEIIGIDRSTDVRHGPDGREVIGFKLSKKTTDELIGKGDIVLVTGGGRGIGTRFAKKLTDAGAKVVLADLSTPSPEAEALISAGKASFVMVDVTDGRRLTEAVEPHGPITGVFHCAGVLADGPLGQVDPKRGSIARSVKVLGWLNAIRAAGSSLKVALAMGSWAGRFGSRHQAHYAAGNAQMAALASSVMPNSLRTVVAEFGPWTNSEMVQTIPAAVVAAMKAEGVDFVGDEAGINALWDDLLGASGPVTHGRDLPFVNKQVQTEEILSVAGHPFLKDHSIDGHPIMPLASAVDLIASTANLQPPFEIIDLRLFAGIVVDEPTRVTTVIKGTKAEIRIGDRQALAYRATIRPLQEKPMEVGQKTGGEPPELSLRTFYDDITFHGPLLQGLISIDGIGEDFVRGVCRTSEPADWIVETKRTEWATDPLVLDSIMQLSGYVAYTRFHRAGTPVGIGRYVQLHAMPREKVWGEVHFGESGGNRFSGTLALRDEDGSLIALAEDTVAELRKVDEGEDEEVFTPDPAWSNPSLWPDFKDLTMRLEMAKQLGIDNPYFAVHEGTAKNVTTVAGRELVNFSSYNYIGLSGDSRVVEEVHQAVNRYGTSVSASRVASGERPFHGELERELALCQGVEDALVFTAGHATNVTTIGHLFGPEDLIFHDELIHDSALQGIKLSGAARRGFRHDDAKHLEEQVKELRRHYEKVLIVVEGVYSMDGDICDLPAMVRVKEKYGC